MEGRVNDLIEELLSYNLCIYNKLKIVPVIAL